MSALNNFIRVDAMLIRKISLPIFTAVLSLSYYMINAQYITRNIIRTERADLRIMFYNVENLFDWFDDPAIGDNEFTPQGQMHWTEKRFRSKLNNLYKVIAAAGEWEPPEIVSFAEVENRFVLNQLVSATPLLKFHYEIVHQDSPDQRGIDVALIYRPDRLDKISERFFSIDYDDDAIPKTRDILYCRFKSKAEDTIHVFINHWPSRYGGQLSSEKNRLYVASVLKSKTDSLFSLNKTAKIIIMGDFNDQPGNKSLQDILQAELLADIPLSGKLYNISKCEPKKSNCGTHKYEGNWSILDQVIVSGDLLRKDGICLFDGSFRIFDPSFLLEADDKYLGNKPNRTYSGYKYHGGFSDHLPVYIDLKISR
jgi:predicted extracellular nuclease